jgi:alpha-tubulin suppressor-like RCC1 family protein
VRVQGLSGTIAGLSSGGTASCVWTTAGLVHCWGGNAFSELGDGGAASSGSTRALSELSGVTQVSVGGDGRASHACALSGGVVHCWGANESGQTGDVSTRVQTPRPRRVDGLPADVTSVATGRAQLRALSVDRRVVLGQQRRRTARGRNHDEPRHAPPRSTQRLTPASSFAFSALSVSARSPRSRSRRARGSPTERAVCSRSPRCTGTRPSR